MFIALDDKKNLVRAADGAANENYYCPACEDKLIFKKGRTIHSHFAHAKQSFCQTFSEGETAEHLDGKLLLYNWFKREKLNVELEAFLPELNQRPDLLVEINGSKIAIEYQCSPISRDKIRERTLGYSENSIRVIWILGDRLKVSSKLQSVHFTYMTKGTQGNYQLFQLNQEDERIEVITDLTSCSNSIHYTKKNLFLTRSRAELCREIKSVHKAVPIRQKTKKNQLIYLNQMSHYRYDKGRRFFELLYENQLFFEALPAVLFTSVRHEWMIVTFPYQWKLMLLLWLNTFQAQLVLTRNVIERKISQWLLDGELSIQNIPAVESVELYRPVYEYLGVLSSEGLLKRVGDDKWVCRINVL